MPARPDLAHLIDGRGKPSVWEGIVVVDIIAPVKRFLCLFLMLWFVVQAGVAQAHVALEDAHRMEHATGTSDHRVADGGADEELCGVAHCCHANALPLEAFGLTAAPPTDRASSAPQGFALRSPPPDIERPKWPSA